MLASCQLADINCCLSIDCVFTLNNKWQRIMKPIFEHCMDWMDNVTHTHSTEFIIIPLYYVCTTLVLPPPSFSGKQIVFAIFFLYFTLLLCALPIFAIWSHFNYLFICFVFILDRLQESDVSIMFTTSWTNNAFVYQNDVICFRDLAGHMFNNYNGT